MACPGACNNGGGQVKPGGSESARELLLRVEAAYHAAEVQMRPPEASPEGRALLGAYLGGAPGSPAAAALLRTAYHARAPLPGALVGPAVSW